MSGDSVIIISDDDSTDTQPFYDDTILNVDKLIQCERDFQQYYNEMERITKMLRQQKSSLPADSHKIQAVEQLKEYWQQKLTELPMKGLQSDQLTGEELMAKIKRTRWCYMCCKPANIMDTDFFCSIECQLSYYDT